MKVFYFADKMHLSKYGRFIYGEKYIAMKKGQVPSWVYDVVKAVRGDGNIKIKDEIKSKIKVRDNYEISTDEQPNVNDLSTSEKDCLDYAIKKYGNALHTKIFFWAHKDGAYRKTELNKQIALDDIVETLDNKDDLKKYLLSLYN